VAAMIEVEALTKWYGRTLALDRASFGVEKGQIVGFLGPNGAGKSTALRILTGYLPATSGQASVAGHDVFLESLAVRSHVGYMPENVPLYGEMRVQEYLRFRAGLKDVPSAKRRAAVERVIERCWLKDVRRRLIGQLSKGFRQRVGLADALVADPPVLILDEPTIGLDPVQIREARRLLQSLEGQHTLLFSSHILWEVERICSHVIIILDGSIAATGAIEHLCKEWRLPDRVVMEIRTAATHSEARNEIARTLSQVTGVDHVRHEEAQDGWCRATVTPQGDVDLREPLHGLARQRGWPLRELHLQRPNLEDLYMKVAEATAAKRAKGAA